ncbi:MAG: PqqD family protein [Ardenticatenales bacterium]|nr:PqqD family protein [Ardenticatenales bacterium]
MTHKPTHHPQIAARVFSDEAVLIDPTKNIVRMLNPVGSRIWELADGTRTLDQIAVVLVDEFHVDVDQATASVETFVEELVSKNLLTWR